MDNKNKLPNKIPIFPISNFIIFPKTTVPLNIFEPRYIDMINDSMKLDKLIGMIQPLGVNNLENLPPKLHKIGCLGKITSFKESDDGSFLIELKGLARFETINEIQSDKKYRQYEVNFENFENDLKKSIDILERISNEKIDKLKFIAKETVDITGIGFYSLGSAISVACIARPSPSASPVPIIALPIEAITVSTSA